MGGKDSAGFAWTTGWFIWLISNVASYWNSRGRNITNCWMRSSFPRNRSTIWIEVFKRIYLLDHGPHVLASGLVVLQDGHELVVCVVLVVGESGLDERHVARRHLLFVRNLPRSHIPPRNRLWNGGIRIYRHRDGRLDGLLTCQVHPGVRREELRESGEEVIVTLEDLLNPRENRSVADSVSFSDQRHILPVRFELHHHGEEVIVARVISAEASLDLDVSLAVRCVYFIHEIECVFDSGFIHGECLCVQ